jgi:hypothetical protein
VRSKRTAGTAGRTEAQEGDTRAACAEIVRAGIGTLQHAGDHAVRLAFVRTLRAFQLSFIGTIWAFDNAACVRTIWAFHRAFLS